MSTHPQNSKKSRGKQQKIGEKQIKMLRFIAFESINFLWLVWSPKCWSGRVFETLSAVFWLFAGNLFLLSAVIDQTLGACLNRLFNFSNGYKWLQIVSNCFELFHCLPKQWIQKISFYDAKNGKYLFFNSRKWKLSVFIWKPAALFIIWSTRKFVCRF